MRRSGARLAPTVDRRCTLAVNGTRQDELELLPYGEALQHRLIKREGSSARERVVDVLITSLRRLAQIPDDRLDFDRARASALARSTL
jgi:hypothetical protein